jgi:two-component system sensor histidine kinase KdpD
MTFRRIIKVIPWLIALAGPAFVTVAGTLIDINVNTAGFVFLIVVLVSFIRGGLLGGIVASIAAALCYNFFFPPLYTFTIHETANWVALAALLATSVAGSRRDRRAGAGRTRRAAAE